jgi:hypothetical protein
MNDDSNFGGGNRLPKPKKTPLENNKLALYTKNEEGKTARLVWTIINNNPRIMVYTNLTADKNNNYGRISANLDLPTMMLVTEYLKSMKSMERGTKYVMENKTFTYVGDKRSDEPSKVSELWIGKDNEGVIWLSVVSENRPKIKFELLLSNYHHLISTDGTPVAKGALSEMMANAYSNMLSSLYTHIYVSNYVEPAELPERPKDAAFGKREPATSSFGSDDISF